LETSMADHSGFPSMEATRMTSVWGVRAWRVSMIPEMFRV